MISSKSVGVSLIAAISITFGWIGYVGLSTVEQRDIYAFHDIEMAISPRSPLRPGDIVEIDNGGEIFPLCRFIGAKHEPVPPQTEVYFNKLHENFASFRETLASFVPYSDSNSNETAQTWESREITFRGARLVPDWIIEDLQEFDKPNCEERMADVLLRGSRPCTVVRSFIEVRAKPDGSLSREVVALKFKQFVNVPVPELRKSGADEKIIAKAYATSCGRNTLPYDVMVRDWLNVIGRRTG